MTIVKDEIKAKATGIQYEVVEEVADLGTEERYNSRSKTRMEYTWKLRRVSLTAQFLDMDHFLQRAMSTSCAFFTALVAASAAFVVASATSCCP